MRTYPVTALKDRIHILTPIGWTRGASILTKKNRTILLFLHSLTMFVCLFIDNRLKIVMDAWVIHYLTNHNATFEHVFKGCTPMGRASSARIRTGSNSLLLFHALLDCLWKYREIFEIQLFLYILSLHLPGIGIQNWFSIVF